MKSSQPHSLQGTRYGKLEMDVKRIIEKQRKRSRDDISPSTNESRTNAQSNDEKDSMLQKKPKHERNSAAIVRNPAVLQHSGPAGNFTNPNTVYIQGFPFSCEEDDIRKLFEAAGTIKSIRLPRWHDSGKLKGYGHIEFATSAGATKALEMTGQYIQDRYITVDRPMVPRALAAVSGEASAAVPVSEQENTDEEHQQPSSQSLTVDKPAGCRTVFIKNLPYDITEEEIRKSFMVYGPIVNVRLAMWNHTQNKKGFGYVDFKREDSADIAVKKSGSISLKDRLILVDFETRAPKKGFKNGAQSKRK